MLKPNTTARQRPPNVLSVTLLAWMLSILVAASIALMGCAGQSPVTPTPTKTPTVVPTATPQATTGAAPGKELAQSRTEDPTATPTLRPTLAATATSTPEPVNPICTELMVPSDVETIQELMDATIDKDRQAAAEKELAELGLGSDVPSPSVPKPAPANTPTPAAPAAVYRTSGSEINPLTGLPASAIQLNRRPLGVKVPNFPFSARPQSGLSRADVVIENEAEAYVTRFMAIFYGNDASLLGPIRSLRLPDTELISIFKATLVASGGHPAVKIRITEGKPWAEGYRRIICPEEPFLGDGGAMRRISKPGQRYELTLYTDTESLWNVVSQRGVNQRPDFGNMWIFDPNPPGGGRPATHLKILYKANWSESEYRYDPNVHAYRRYDVGQPLIDELTGQQLAPANVLLLYANHINSDILADTHDPDHPWYAVLIQLWGQGSGKLFRDGQMYEIQWVRQDAQGAGDRLLILDGQGNQVSFRPGTTWIQLARPGTSVQID